MRVLNVGCGPAVEIQRFARQSPHSDQLEFVLVDFSEETLEYTRQQLEEASRPTGRKLKLTLQHESVNQLQARDAHTACRTRRALRLRLLRWTF